MALRLFWATELPKPPTIVEDPPTIGVFVVVFSSSIKTSYNPSLSTSIVVSWVKPSYFGISSKLEKAFVSASMSDFTTSSFWFFNSISLNFSQLALSLSISGRASYSSADKLGFQLNNSFSTTGSFSSTSVSCIVVSSISGSCIVVSSTSKTSPWSELSNKTLKSSCVPP